MYSPKIKEDLVPKIYQKAKLKEKPMTKIVDDLLRLSLMDNEDVIYKCCSCMTQVDTVEGDKGYCEYCESVVFVQRA